jgi:hypothetical protein
MVFRIADRLYSHPRSILSLALASAAGFVVHIWFNFIYHSQEAPTEPKSKYNSILEAGSSYGADCSFRIRSARSFSIRATSRFNLIIYCS